MKGRIVLYAILRRPYSVDLGVSPLEKGGIPRRTKEGEGEGARERPVDCMFLNQMTSTLARYGECFDTRVGVG